MNIQNLSKQERIKWLIDKHISEDKREHIKKTISSYDIKDSKLANLHDQFIENTIGNFCLPFAVANNFIINDKPISIPMVIEESSVVSAASKSAKFWMNRGGFKTNVISKEKIGHIHFLYNDEYKKIKSFFSSIKADIIRRIDIISQNMKKRNGGLISIELIPKTDLIKNYYQIEIKFDTVDSMGANLINTCLEETSKIIKEKYKETHKDPSEINIIMSILSNYNKNCLVKAEVSCPIEKLKGISLEPFKFAYRFSKAIEIAEKEIYRAVTHNKGILNGIDALMIATANDFRAVEAAAHSYACRNNRYEPLTKVSLENDIFYFYIQMPICLGTIGGLTSLHPMSKVALEILNNPNANELMQIAAALGLAQNFAAISALITTGIQKGHMNLHLSNILNSTDANDEEKKVLINLFRNKPISYGEVLAQLNAIRNKKTLD